MESFNELQKNISNKDVDWAKHYDYFEVEFRNMYKTVSKPQNVSHFEMLKSKGSEFLKRENVFCEIGFSAGLTLRYALKYFGKVYGLDISPKNVEFTEKELNDEGYKDFELHTSDLMDFDARFENKFDVISYIHGLEHFSANDYPVIFNNLKKYLKPGGVFTGALPFKNIFNFRMCPDCGKVFELDGHVSSHDISSLKKVFEDNGFDILHLASFNLKFLLKSENIIKAIYKILSHLLFDKNNGQLEYIVMSRK